MHKTLLLVVLLATGTSALASQSYYKITASDVLDFKQLAKCGINDKTGLPVVPKPTIQKMSECRKWRARCLQAFDQYFQKPSEVLSDKIIDELECFEY